MKKSATSSTGKVIDSPCGVAACSSMPGGGALAGFKHTDEPELVGKFLNFAAPRRKSADNDFLGGQYPDGSVNDRKSGIEYRGRLRQGTGCARRHSSTRFRKWRLLPIGFQGWPFQRAMMNSMTTRISQVINNEMDIDTALERIDQDVRLAISAAQN